MGTHSTSQPLIDTMDFSEVRRILGSKPPEGPLPDEIEAFRESEISIALEGTVPFNLDDWA